MANTYTVSQINTYIKNMFAQDFLLGKVTVKGEVSNCTYHSSGHIYFTLKDRNSTIAGVMFAGNRGGLNFRLETGNQIAVTGAVGVYERDGKYQLYAERITADGQGLLYEQYLALKDKLEEMGMFAPEYKQAIPRYIRTLGVVTAPTGAAVRDIITVAKSRNPYIQIILYPAIVQGENAAASIVAGIEALTELNVDLIIIGRGGGSLEDLWAFNEESVAQAVFDCPIPLISAVGHETDTTIADFVADLRAPTPSVAAEQAVYDVVVFEDELAAQAAHLQRLLQNRLEVIKYRMLSYRNRLQAQSPLVQLREKRMLTLTLEERLVGLMTERLTGKRHSLSLLAERLKGLSPLEKLSQGYAYLENAAGRAVTGIGQVARGDILHVHVKDGLIKAAVEETHEIGR
jgi:exodeoxyribonuclease VII large subunit